MVNTDYTFNGEPISESFVIEAAEVEGLSVDEYVNQKDGLEIVEVTDEIQTTPTEGKTNDVAVVDAAVTSEPDTASESTESDSVDTSGESENPDWLKEDIVADLNTVGDIREIDKRIKLLAGNNKDLKFVKEGEISLLDSPKRLFQYNKLINRKNDILKQTDKDIKNLATEEKIVESFDVEKPAIEGDSYITDEGGVYIASAPLVVDGEVVGSQAQPVSIGEVEVVGKRLSVDELSKKYNNFKDKAIADSFDVVATALELVPFESEFKTYVQEKSKENRSKRDLYNKLYQEGKIDLDATRSAFNTINNSMRTMVNLDDQFSYLDALIFSQSPDEETSKQGYSKLKKARENLNLKESYFLPTQRFDRLKEKSNAFEYVTGGLAGLFDAGMAVATTVAQTTPGLAVNILSSNLKEHNTIAAQRMGMTNEEYLKSGQADFVTPTVTTAFELGSEWLRLKQISNYINALPVGTQRQIAKTMTVMGGNGAQEIFQYGLNDFNKNDAAGMNFSQASMASIKAMLSPEAFEVGLKGAFGSGPIAVGGRLFNSNELKAQAAIKTTAEKGRIQSAINKLYELDQAKYSKNISTEQLKAINTAQYQIRKGLTSEVDANDKLVASLSEDQLEIINQNADLLTSIGAEIQATRDADNLTDAQKESILEGLNEARKQASQQIYDVRNRAEADAATSKVQQVVSDLEAVNMQTLSTEEIQNYLQDNNLVENQDDAIKKSSEGAFIIQNTTTGEQEIIVNKDIGSISDAAHEGLHALMLQTVRKSPDTAIRLGESLRNELNKLDPNLIEDSGIRKRLELYNQDPTAVQMEEVLTLFSDTVTNGTVEFNDSTFTKIGDFIRQFLSKLGVKAKFNNGRDVYNFIKDYNKSIESGKLTRGQVRAAKEGVRGKLVGPKIETFDDATIKQSRKLTPEQDQQAQDKVKDIQKVQQEGEKIAKNFNKPFEKSAKQQRLERELTTYIKPTLDSFVESRTKALYDPIAADAKRNVTRQDFVESMKSDIISMTIAEFKAKQPLEKFITSRGFLRANSLAKKLGIKSIEQGIDQDLKAASKVATDTDADTDFDIDTNLETETRQAQSPRQTTKFNTDFAENLDIEVEGKEEAEINEEAQKQFDKAIAKDLEAIGDVTTFAQTKDIGPALAALMEKATQGRAEEIVDGRKKIVKTPGMPAAVFSDKSKNIAKKNADSGALTALKQFLDINAQRDFNNLPDAFSPETGKATFIPENVKKALYRKNDQGRFVLDKSKTVKDYRNLLGDMVKPVYRASEAQTIKGLAALSLRNRMFEQAVPDVVARKTTGVKFSKQVDGALTPGQSQNIGKVFNKLGNQEKITFVQNIDPFFDAITKDDYNVETAFNNIFGPDFLKGKKKQDFINEWSKVRGSLVDLKNYNKGKPKKTTVQDYLYQAFEEQTQSEVVENILGVKKGGVNFRSKDQLMGYVNFINSYIAKKAESLNDFELAEFVINDLGPTLSAGAKVGGNDFMWQRDADTDLLVLVPSTLDRSNSIRTSLFGNQREMAEVLIKPFISDKSKLTYKGNKPLWDGVPLLKKGYKVDQSVNTYLTSIKKNGGITNEMLDKSQEYADQQVKNIIDILDYYKSLPKDSETTIDDLGMFFRASNGDMTAMVRAAANVDSFAGDGKGAYRYEHNPPARTMLVRMAEYVNGTITKQELKNEFDKYTVSIIPQQMDDVINERYKDTVPLVGSRYYNAFTYGRFPFAMNIYKKQSDGSYKTETIGEYQKQAYESQIKASRSNNNQLMPVVKFAKQVPNSEVLNRMSELDADAKQANKEFYDSVDLNKDFNDILEVKTGIASEKRYKRVKAEVVGANKGRFQFFIPPSAEDFTGLLYSTLAKGKLGDAQMAWYKKNLLDPYGKAMNELSSARIAMMNDYKQLKKELKIVPKDLRKKVPGEPFTREQAVRVYIWQKQGMSVPGISEADMQDLSEYVTNDTELQLFAEQLINIQKGDQYAGPKEGWPAGTITTDMLEGLNTIKRAKALEQWQANADEIFSEENLNKIEAAYGKPYRKAMENMLQRMKSGRNRNFQGDTLTGRVTDWLTGSIGTIMFFNTRSAILQTISSINFVNFTDNNILAAGKAFANQKQYWSDFMTLMNSDFLKERRGGLRINVNEADIADMAKRGGARGVINKLLEFGFTPTQIADSFAIASGGATFYRNRIKSLKKQGMKDAEAEAQAFVDFRETAEESQQSSRPDRISMQQAGQLGRLVLAFANTPAQYARLIKKAASDLKNGRGDAKTNISKIIYYGVAQNLLFNALQQALFAFAFDDDEEDTDEQQKKYVSIANGMMDSLLRGMGLGGAVVSVGKNAIKRIIDEMEKKQPKLEKVGYELTKLSPPISAKLSRVNQAARSYQWDKKDMMEKGWSLDNPAYLASANVISALTNIPLDRAVKKTNNVVQATSQDLETWERLALLGGWQDWEIGIDEEKPSNKPQPRKSKITKKRKLSKR